MGDGLGFGLVIVIWRHNIVFWRQGVTSHNFSSFSFSPADMCI